MRNASPAWLVLQVFVIVCSVVTWVAFVYAAFHFAWKYW